MVISNPEDGPAVELASGDRYWFRNDRLHPEDGPAIERADGYRAWYLYGQFQRVER